MGETRGKLYGVSVGPGDPELLTLRAARVLREVDCIAAPDVKGSRRAALGIVGSLADGKAVIDCSTPMTHDRVATARAYDAIADELAARLDSGESVAFVTLGDASIYSTWSYVQSRMVARGYEVEVVPGVPSFCAAAARLGEPLCEGPEQLLVAPAAAGDPQAALGVPGTKVFMKSGRKLADIQRLLRSRGTTAAMVADCGLEGELVARDFTALDDPRGYMAVVIARDGERRAADDADDGERFAPESFFQNRACPYFPCHEGVPSERFNCLFCYCPLYALGEGCGGGCRFTEAGVKDCSACTLPHDGAAGARMVRERFPEIAALARSVLDSADADGDEQRA